MVKIGDMYYAQAKSADLAHQGECGGALTATIKYLLEKGLIDAALVLKKGSDLYDAVPVLLDDPEDLIDSAGSLHCGTHNMAKIVVEYLDGIQDFKLAVTTKPCDARTLKELIKMGQINKDNIIMLGVNCGGTLPPVETRSMVEKCYGLPSDQVLKEEIARGKLIIKTQDKKSHGISIDQLEEAGYGRRPNCRRCDVNIPSMADLAFGNWGVIGPSAGEKTFLEVFSQRGAEILENAKNEGYLDLEDPLEEGVNLREQIDDSMVKLAQKWQSSYFDDENHDIVSVINRARDEFEKCIKCFGCREACPICFCEDCTLESEAPEWLPPGEIPAPLNFHLERMIHMVDSCTNCGQCEDVCPVDIPLSRIWQEVNLDIRNILGYRSGMDDKLPPLSYLLQLKKD
jgi:formate dehydrogenase (coenzyme F420) beta subunit